MTCKIRKEKGIKKGNSIITVGLSQTDLLAGRGYPFAIRQIVYKILLRYFKSLVRCGQEKLIIVLSCLDRHIHNFIIRCNGFVANLHHKLEGHAGFFGSNHGLVNIGMLSGDQILYVFIQKAPSP
jgi:hypothetical protein